MKNRRVLLAVVGIVSIYVVIHAAMSGYALYLIDHALRLPALISGPYASDSRTPFAALFLIMLALSGLSVAAFAAFWRDTAWARKLWLAFSLVLLVCVAAAVLIFQARWTDYLFELGAVAVSWLYLRRAQGAQHAG